VHVARAGRIVTARSRPALLLHRARLAADGEPLVDGRPWADPGVLADVQAAAGAGAALARSAAAQRFDVLPLLVATDGAIAALGYDRRRFRPNLVIGGVDGWAERGWEGRRLAVGEAIIEAVDLRARCIMTTFDPDSGEQDVEVLKRIHRELDGTFALNCAVGKPGVVRVGAPVRLLD
jgi:uncharacterized protein YcbX